MVLHMRTDLVDPFQVHLEVGLDLEVPFEALLDLKGLVDPVDH